MKVNQKLNKLKGLASILLIILPVLFSVELSAQDCNCNTNFEWLKKTFEENDAGFQYALERKGEIAYQLHNQLFSKRLKRVRTNQECLVLLNDWTTFFREKHLVITSLKEKSIKESKVNFEFAKAEKINITDSDLFNHLEGGEEKSIEGIYISYQYTIAVIKDSMNENRDFVGVILKSKNSNWNKNEVKFEISKTQKNNSYKVDYYMANHAKMEWAGVRLNNDVLKIGNFYFYRKLPKMERYLKLLYSNKPYIETLSKNIILLRIPSFKRADKPLIDSLLSVNHDLITTTKYLIIDFRNNYGGADNSHDEVSKYLYTNPIRIAGEEYLSTPLNNKRMAEIANSQDKKFSQYGKESLKLLNKHLGKFVNTHDKDFSILELDTVFTNPQKVAILMNENCASATESFIFKAKQSSKVKLYGKTTMGAYDISNMYFVKSPCGDYQLGYGLTKRIGLTEKNRIDDVGFQPDFYLDEDVLEYDWIDFVINNWER